MFDDIDLDGLGLVGMSYDELLEQGLGGSSENLPYFERLAAERLEQKNAFTADLKQAAQSGADLSQIPQGFIRVEMSDAEQDSATPRWSEAPQFNSHGWEEKVRFRCSSLGLLMTGQDGGAAAQNKAEKARARLVELQQDLEELGQKDLLKFEQAKQAEAAKIEAAKTETARAKARQKLQELEQDGPAQSASTLNKFAAVEKARSELKLLENEAAQGGAAPLSGSAKRVCEDLFATAFFGYDTPKKALSFLHGTVFEQVCLERYGLVHGIEIPKNSERVTVGLLTGECDVNWSEQIDKNGRKIIRENKAPINAESFVQQVKKNKREYFWQVQGYLHLYGADEAHLILNLTPNIFQDEQVYDHLPASYLTQTFSIKRCQKSIDLMLAVLDQAYEYTLDFGRQMIGRLGKITTLEIGDDLD